VKRILKINLDIKSSLEGLFDSRGLEARIESMVTSGGFEKENHHDQRYGCLKYLSRIKLIVYPCTICMLLVIVPDTSRDNT
jgi:hypothetical protein